MLAPERAYTDAPDCALVAAVAQDPFSARFRRLWVDCRDVPVAVDALVPASKMSRPVEPLISTKEWLKLLPEVIAALLDEEEEFLEVHREAVAGALRQAVRFVPDDLVSHNPAAVNHFERKACRKPHQALAGKTRRRAVEIKGTIGRR